MSGALERILYNYPKSYLSDIDVSILIKGTPDSRYGQIKRLLAQKKLLRIRRGLYCLSDKIQPNTKSHPFELAQYIYGPSYISLESALSYHRLIPEAVYEVTSVCIKRSKIFDTPIGLFSYKNLYCEQFYTDVDVVIEKGAQFLMAKPWKAISDYIFLYKKNWDGLQSMIEDLRIDHDDLPLLNIQEMERLDAYYQNQRVSRFLKKVYRST